MVPLNAPNSFELLCNFIRSLSDNAVSLETYSGTAHAMC